MKRQLLILVLLLGAATAQAAFPFVTTTSPTTYPIHWYQLTINNKYVYFDPNGGIYDQVQLTPTASTEDNFLWCFIQVSSDKIVIYNKAAQGYLEEAQFIVNDINSSYICHVVESSVEGFYISYYHTGDKRTYYLYEYIGDGYDFLSSASAVLSTSTFNVIEILVEGDIVSVEGDVNGDGSVNAADVTALYSFILNGNTTYEATSDINNDNSINAADVTAVYKIILGQQ